MYLSKLEIIGFKSFVQKAVFKFDQGLTAIIGPNGCGKSNIVDAIRWVLGEQRPSVLRCDRMENLIFNGTATRKPLGYSEVSLYIENTRQILPSEYTEIKITRRLYRSGESEYLVNNKPVRLMDIINLFSDTGMGADAYSVIELKMVEQIISDNAEERRRLFEEAAGIKKYKARRKSALRKLEKTQQELERLNDIISEVQKNVNSLSRQVGKARRYHQYKQTIKEKELIIGHLKLASFQQQSEPLRLEFKQVQESAEKLSGQVYSMEAKLETLQAREAGMESEYREIAAEMNEKDEQVRELLKQIQMNTQKISSLEEAIDSDTRELRHQEEKTAQITTNIAAFSRELQALEKQLLSAKQAHETALSDQARAEENYRLAKENYEGFLKKNLEQLHRANAEKEAHQKIRVEREELHNRLQQNQADEQNLEEQLTAAKKRMLDFQNKEKVLAGEMQQTQQEVNSLQRMIEKQERTLEATRQAQSDAEVEWKKLMNEEEFLAKLIENYEGFSESVQYIMSHKSRFNGLVDTLANLVDSTEEYRPAVESFIAEIANYLIVEKIDTAREMLEHFRNNGKGRLTLIPLSLLGNNRHPQKTRLSLNGKTIPLKEVVTTARGFEKIFEHLFEDTYIVPDMEEAIHLHQQYPDNTYVTAAGEILGRWGTISSGVPAHNFSLLGRQKQLQQLQKQKSSLERQKGKLQSRSEKENTALREQRRQLEVLQARLKELESQFVALDGEAKNLQYEHNLLTERRERIEKENAGITNRLQELAGLEKELLPVLESQQQQLQTYQLEETRLLNSKNEAETALSEQAKATQELQIRYLNLMNQTKNLKEKISYSEESLQEAHQFVQDRKERISRSREQIAALRQANQEIDASLQKLYLERDEVEDRKNQVENRYQETKGEIQVLEGELKKKHRLWNQARERLQELELRIKELEVKSESLREQMEEKFGEAAREFEASAIDPAWSIPRLQEELEAARQKLDSLGEVNPLAIKEHEQEKERLDFLKAQRDDLLTAEKELLETIHKLNKKARKQFLDTFHKIQTNFQRVFGEFFDGGSAELLLVENKDPLEANIDISVTIKGKKLHTLSLLSAGEKTLTAISLLFSIYLVKPSPFCILDEVDAPLDDVNVSRFTQALKQFSKETQFILVTHNKRTMEATQFLYGITMEEPGISKVVSVQLD